MKNRRKWRRWIKAIDNTIYMPIRIYTPIFKGYIQILEKNPSMRKPFHFHEWILHNHSNTILLTMRKIADKDPRSHSVRRLLGDVLHNNKSLTLRSYMHRCPKNFKDTHLNFWRSVCGDHDFIPKGIVQRDLNEIKKLTEKARKAVNQTIAHISKDRKYRTFEFDSIYADIEKTLQIFQKYSVLLRCPEDNSIEAVITHDWRKIFKIKWI